MRAYNPGLGWGNCEKCGHSGERGVRHVAQGEQVAPGLWAMEESLAWTCTRCGHQIFSDTKDAGSRTESVPSGVPVGAATQMRDMRDPPIPA